MNIIKKDYEPFPEGIEKALTLLSKKWIMGLLYILREGDYSFTVLRTELKTISNQELAKKLKLLEQYNLIEHTDAFMTDIERAVYRSTVTGKDLCDLIIKIKNFGEKYL